MLIYIVKFMKNVFGEYGWQSEVCQGMLEIDVFDEDEVCEWVKVKFCEEQVFNYWLFYVDCIYVKLVDFFL